MADPPGNLGPKVSAFMPTGKPGSAANPSKVGVASTAMPGPAKASADEAATASSDNRTTNRRLREQLAEKEATKEDLRAQVQRLEREKKEVQKKDLSWQNRLELELTKKYNEIFDASTLVDDEFARLNAYDVELDRKFAELEAERQKSVAQLTVVEQDGQSKIDPANSAELNRRLALLVADSDAVKAIAAAEVTKTLALKKLAAQTKDASAEHTLSNEKAHMKRQKAIIAGFFKSVQTFHLGCEEDRRTLLAKRGKAGPADERRYARSDIEFQKFAEERYLAGYIDSNMAFELRNAFQKGLPVPESRLAYLRDNEHEKNPYQVGQRIGRVFGWRVICHLSEKPQWDDSLDTRQWTDTSQFWNITTDFPIKGIFGGIQKGYAESEAAMNARLIEEQADSTDEFKTVVPKAKVKLEFQARQKFMQDKRAHQVEELEDVHSSRSTSDANELSSKDVQQQFELLDGENNLVKDLKELTDQSRGIISEQKERIAALEEELEMQRAVSREFERVVEGFMAVGL